VKIGPLLDTERLQQRLQDAAVIAGRMAHEFNNVLTTILGFSDLSAQLVPKNSQPANYMAEIGKSVQRGIRFTQQLHQFDQSGSTAPQPGQLLACLTKEEARLRPTAPPGVQLRVDVPTACGLVAIENVPLSAVLGHVLENAFDASPPHGVVRVFARPVEMTTAEAKTYLGRATVGSYVEVTIQDEGPGIKPDVRARLFAEPFFTTKVRHRGLGLAVAFRALTAHAGGIRLDPVSADGTGTAVRVVLPAASRPPITTPRPTIITKHAS
jgi:signal transduction histidine kinase